MAHYEVTHTCGHIVRVNLIGSHSSREWRIERMRQEVCRDCWQAQELAMAQQRATAAGWHEWTAGTLAQRDWAERIRVSLIERLDSAYQAHTANAGEAADLAKVATLYAAGKAQLLQEQTDAKWWIDHRMDADSTLLRLTLNLGVALRPDLDPRPQDQRPAPPAPVPPSPALPEHILRPEHPVSETIATVSYEPAHALVAARLVVRFPDYHTGLRDVLRDLEYQWQDRAWVRSIAASDALPDRLPHRLAETATRLVAAGYVTRLRDEAAYALAVDGTFQVEPRRWVRACVSGEYQGWLALTWSRRDDLYDAFLRLRGARYRSGKMLVPAGSADEIEEFARIYDFAISSAARALLDEVHQSQAHGFVLSAAKTKASTKARRRRTSGDGAVPVSDIPPVLPVPEIVEVADALRDDD